MLPVRDLRVAEWSAKTLNVRTLCLAVLNCGESTGYEIRKLATDGPFSHFVDASYGSIYPALARLEDDRLVESRAEVQEGKPNRKVYSITQAGREAFVDSLAKPAQPDIFKSEFLLLAMFAAYIEPRQLDRAIEAQKAFLREEIATIEEHLDKVDIEGAAWVANYGCHCLRASLDYVENRADELRAIAGSALDRSSMPIAAE